MVNEMKMDYGSYDDTVTQVEARKLETVRYKLAARLSEAELHNFDVSVIVDRLAEQIEFRVQHELYAEKHPQRRIIYPRDWWQAFKKRWFPGWLLKRFPVVYTEYVISVATLYPDIKPLDGYRAYNHLEMIYK